MTAASVNEVQLRTATAEPDLDQVRSLLREYNEFLFDIIDPALLRHRETELEELPGAFAPPRGAPPPPLQTHPPPPPAECCRMWVTHAARGRSLGRVLVQKVIDLAREQGYTALYLNNVPETMAAAYRLYLEFGFVPVAPYKHVAIPGIRFFRLALSPATAAD